MKVYTVDSFTNVPFAGNPAGVCILDNPIEDILAIKIAAEINFSETAFVLKDKIANTFQLRWFTPTEEVDLCGHATLATAWILYYYGYVEKNVTINFNTRSGVLTSKLMGNKIEMDFPAGHIASCSSDTLIQEFAGSEPVFVGANGDWCLVELDTEEAVKKIKPDFSLLLKHTKKIFIITAKATNSNYDFVSRCFGPSIGINEDPVTGSAHCYLAPYWNAKLNKKILTGFQVSKRTGIVECEPTSNNRVLLRGEAIIMSELKQNW